MILGGSEMTKDGKANAQGIGTLFRIPSFEVGVTGVLCVAAVFWVLIYAYVPQQYREVVALVGAAAACVGALLAAFYAGRTLAHMVKQENDKLSFEKKKAALQFVERWNSADMIPTLRACKLIWKIGMNEDGARKVSEILEKSDGADEKRREILTHVGRLLNFMEEISLSVQNELVDEDAIKQAYKGTIGIVTRSTSVWRCNERGRRGTDTLWTEIDKLNDRWHKQT